MPAMLQRRSHAPAELPKDAGSFDLPIALGTLAGSGQLASELFEQYAVVGELALEGTTRPVKGALSMAIAAAKQRGLKGIVVPAESAAESAVVEEIEAIPVAVWRKPLVSSRVRCQSSPRRRASVSCFKSYRNMTTIS